MKIESLTINNFRQFCGEVTLELSTDPDKNVTVVHGANGSGKTSLLNAFKWCFYGQTDFDTLNENILNEAAIQSVPEEGGVIDLSIIVKFTHENLRYSAIRTQSYKRSNGMEASPIGKDEFALDVTGSDGQTKRSRLPSVELQAILPQDLQPYFFFNGERIEHIAGINQSVQIQDAIRKLMGLELVDRAVIHVGKAKNQYRKLVREEVSEEQKGLHDLIEHLEEDIKRYEENISNSKRNEELAKSEVIRIERELKQYEKSRELQETRKDLESKLTNNNDDVKAIKTKQKRLIDENGFLVLSADMFDKCSILVEENRSKGVLPYGINEQFIDDRIDLGTCICGTKIVKNSKEHDCLLDVKKTAGSDEQESSYTSVSAILKTHKDMVANYKRDYKEEAHSLEKVMLENERYRNDIDEISAQLIHIDDKQIATLESEHVQYTKKRDEAVSNKGVAINAKIGAETKKEEHNEQLKRLDDQRSRQNIARRRMDKSAEIVEVLTALRESLSDQVRVDLSEKVDKTFQSIIRKPVRAIIDDDYRLQVLKKSSEGEEYIVNEQSTGERQVTSLSFISSIIALAKEKHAKKTLFFQGGLYPLVMDSPFGALDDDYREKVAGGVADLAEQVIMFVSNSQWAGRVKKACEGKVGKSYQLIYHSPTLEKSKEDEYTVCSENEFEYSTLREV